MGNWWEKPTGLDAAARRRAVAYYRHSAEIGQENSVEIQQDNIRKFAQEWVRLSSNTENRIELHGHSGLELIKDLVT